MGTRPTISLRKVKRNRKWISFVATGVLGVSTVSTADAASVIWNLAGNGYWDVAGNWSGGSEPGINDDVTNSSIYQITLSDDSNPGTPVNYFANSLTNDGAGSFLINNACSLTVTTTLSNSTGSTVQTSGLNSTLNVDGTVTNNASTIYTNSGATINLDLGGATTLSNTNASQMYATGVDSGTNTPSVLNIGSAANVVGTVTNDNSTMEADTGAQMNVFADTLSNQNSASLYSFDGSTVTINAYTLNNTNGSTIFDNGSGGGGGYLTDNSFEIDNNASDIHAFNEGVVNLDATALLTNEQSAAMYAYNGSTLNLNTAPTLGNGNILNETNSSISADGSQDVVNSIFLPQSTVNMGYSGDTASLTNDSSSIYAVNGGAVFVTMGSVTNQNGGNIYADGSNSQDGYLSSLSINSSVLDNNNSTISSTNGSSVYLSGSSSLTNEVSGSIYAYQNGTVTADAGTLTNQTGAQIYADGSSDSSGNPSSAFALGYNQNINTFTNDNASIYAVNGGQGTINVNTLTNQDGGVMYASGSNGNGNSMLTVNADNITVDSTNYVNNSSLLQSQIYSSGATVNLNATGSLTVQNEAYINAFGTNGVTNIGSSNAYIPTVTITNTSSVPSPYSTGLTVDAGGTLNVYANNFYSNSGSLNLAFDGSSNGAFLNVNAGTIENNSTGFFAFQAGTINLNATTLNNTNFSTLSANDVEATPVTSFLNITAANLLNDSSNIFAADLGVSTITSSNTITNQNGGAIYATADMYTPTTGPSVMLPGGAVNIGAFNLVNDGSTGSSSIYAIDGGNMNITSSTTDNQNNGDIYASGSNSSTKNISVTSLGATTLNNTGNSTISANAGAQVNLLATTLNNNTGSQLYASDPGSVLNIGTGPVFSTAVTTFTNDNGLISADNSGTVNIGAANFSNQDGGSIFTGTGTPGGTINIATSSLDNTGSGSNIQAVDGGTLNITGGTITTEQFASLSVNGGSSATLLGSAVNILSGGSDSVSGTGSTLQLGSTTAPITTVSLDSITVSNVTNYGTLTAFDGGQLNMYAGTLNIQDGAYLSAYQSSVSQPLPSVNLGDPSNPLGTISLTNAAGTGTSDLGVNQGTMNIWANTISVDGASQLYSQSTMNVGDATHMVNSLTVNGDGSTAYMDATGGSMNVYATSISNKNVANIEAYGTGGVLNLLNSTGTVTNDGTNGYAVMYSSNGGSLNILAGTLNNLGGGRILNNDSSSTLSLGSTSSPIGTINNIGVSPLTDANYSQILANAGQTLQIYATNINQSSAGVMAAGQFGDSTDAGTVLNIGDANHYVTTITNTGSGPLNEYGTTAIRAHFGSTVNLYATNLDNSSYARIYSLQDNSALSGGTMNIHATTLSNSTNGDVFSTGTGSTTTIDAGTVNNDATIEALGGGLTAINTTTLNNTSNGILHADGTSVVTIHTPNNVESSGSVVVDKGGSIGINNTLTITGGTSTVDGTLTTTGTTLSGGTLQGTGTLASSLMQTGGVFNPGQDPASMNLMGDYSLTSGIYQLDISSPTSFDMLNVSGSSNITGGTLSLDFLNGYIPKVGSSYNFLIASLGYGSTDKFSSINSNLGSGWSFGYGSGTASVLGAPPPAVPEASSVLGLLSMLGMSGIGIALRKRRS